jgi:large repetitive protein
MMKKYLLTNMCSNFSISNLTCVMNHLKFFQRVSVVVLLLLAGLSSRVSAQTCPTSNEITITVVPDLNITAQPIDVTECVSGTNTMFVTVVGGTGTTSYQWQSSPTGAPGTFTDLSGETSASITPSSAVAGTTHYQVVITSAGTGCGAITSTSAKAVITPQLTFTTSPNDITECLNGSLPLTVVVSGATGTLSYVWKSSTTPTGTFTAVAGAPDAATYTPAATATGTVYYQVEVSASGNGCSNITSTTATVTVTPQLSISVTPTDITECVGGTTPLTVNVLGATGTLTYQWYSSATGAPGTFTIMSSETAATLTPNSGSVGITYYQVEVNAAGNGCASQTSTAAKVEITPDMTISAQPTSVVQCLGGSQQLSVAVTGATGTISYQWQSSPDGAPGSFVDITTNGTSATYTPLSASVGVTYFQVIIKATGNGCGDVTSTSTTVEITPELTISAQPASLTECIGGTSPLTVTVAGATGALTYKWKSSTTGTPGSFTDVAGAPNAASYTPDASAVGTTYYEVEISAAGNGCDAITSTSATVTITPQLTIPTGPQDIVECVGGVTPLSVVVAGATGTLTYQWYSSSTGTPGSFSPMSGETAVSLVPNSASTGITYYQVEIKAAGNGCSNITSTAAKVEITPDMTISAQPNSIVQCLGGSQQLIVAVTGATGTISYQWQSSPDGAPGSFVDISGATAANYTPVSTGVGTTYYQVIVKAAGNGCGDVTSTSTTVEITPELTISAQPASLTECIGGTSPLTVTVAGATGALTYKWKSSTTGTPGSFTDVAGAPNAASYTPDASSTGTTFYQVEISAAGNGCDAITSTSATVVITPQLSITAAPQNITECIDGTNQLSVTVAGATGTISYQWQSSATGVSGSFADISGATGATHTPSSSAAGITYYQVVINATGNGCGSITSLPATVEIIPDLSIATQPDAITECIGGTLPLTVAVTGGSGIISYQWQSSTTGAPGSFTNIAGATSATYIPDATSTGVTHYQVVISASGTGCGAITSTSTTVTVVPKPTVAAAVSTTTLCVGGAVQLNATTAGGTGTCTIQWQNNTSGTWSDIPGENGTTYTTPPLSADTKYRAQFICNGNGCCDK